ncbi:tripartite tricarboxylate transporter substrate binding protein [Polynucleobacter sp. 71A-WALBACH]|uniref:Bug family tripartite tricarboxylate transporter substrate binding protein n=1 Tax=Polynucleobacter sp. 71A-WALBACH TaxID=2689097 RepID=UPI001C0C63F5|nr:tripartite tricarboxylate transporter substrate binding protein [Polynucleobacter sp. 71A-WALBACH]MBU3594293.1 tripartite tricarboxylate transporter substrate binding protein [Polynucleobacter sp. 71A-WALBACH]
MKIFIRIIFSLVIVFYSLIVLAQRDYPSRPVTIVVPFASGGVTDVVARLYAQHLTKRMDSTFYVENKPGAGGTVGTDYVARATPDGYTLGIFLDSNTIAPALYANLGSDPIKDFTLITMIAEGQHIIVANPSFPPNTLKELIDYIKSKPGEPYASTGQGTAQHLGMELIKLKSGIDITHVPYKGGGQAITDLVGGQVKFGMLGLAPSLPYIKSGKLKAIAVTGQKRSNLLPNTPTVSETLPGVYTLQWFGVVAPAGLSMQIQQKLLQEINAISKEPEVRQRLANIGLDASLNTSSADFYSFMLKDLAKWPPLVKAAGIKPE